METAAIAFLSALAGGLLAMLGNLIVANRASEHRIKEARYSHLYEKRMEVIAELYRLAAKLEYLVGDWLSTKGDDANALEESEKRAVKAMVELYEFLHEHTLYLTYHEYEAAMRVMAVVGLGSVGRIRGTKELGLVSAEEARKYLENDLPELRRRLQQRFQQAIGLESEPQPRLSSLRSLWHRRTHGRRDY